MNIWGAVTSIFNPTNEQKALNAVSSLLSIAKTVDTVIDPILSLYAPLGALAKLLDEGIVIIQAAVTELQAVVAKQKGS